MYCDWADSNERLKTYHDVEWGVPVHDDKKMFEHLTLECLQCGLSWDLMLKKRAVFKKCFCDFDFEKIASFCEADVERIMNEKDMLRSPRKIRAVINNARRFIAVREEFGSFCDYLWAFTGGKTVLYDGHADGKIPVSNALSEKIAKDLKKRGFAFVGAITVYSHLQACGIINDHDGACPRYKAINKENPVAKMACDGEIY